MIVDLDSKDVTGLRAICSELMAGVVGFDDF